MAAGADLARILAAEVFMRGANRAFSELTADDVRMRAQELRDAVGWGPTARVAPVAQARRATPAGWAGPPSLRPRLLDGVRPAGLGLRGQRRRAAAGQRAGGGTENT